MKNYYLYILSGRNYGPVYIDMTSNLVGRMKQHCDGHLTQDAFRIDRLVHIESFTTEQAARARAKSLKSASREWLDALVQRKNPNWTDMLSSIKQAAKHAA